MMIEEFQNIINTIASIETSNDPEGWSENNPLWGHCAVVALLAQDVFGGTILRGSLLAYPKYEHVRSHYWNRLPEQGDVDFTASQFSDLSYADLSAEVRERSEILTHPNTEHRYKILKDKFCKQ